MVDPSDPSDPSGDNQEKSAATDIASQRSAAHFFRWMMKGQWHQHQWQFRSVSEFIIPLDEKWWKIDWSSYVCAKPYKNVVPFICMHLLSLSTGPGVNGVGNTRGPQIQQNHGSSWKWGLQPGETLDGEEISWPNYIMLINVIYIHIWPCIHKSKFQSTSKKSKTHRRSPWDGDGGRGGERERKKK